MPANKNAVVRYRILDELLSDRHHYYTRKDLLEKCNQKLVDMGYPTVSKRTIELDLYDIDTEFDGISIDWELVVGGKHVVRYEDPSMSIFTKKLSDEEMTFLREVLNTLGQFSGLDSFEWLGALQTRLKNEAKSSSVQDSDRKAIISFSRNLYLNTEEGSPVANALAGLYSAISNKVPVEVSYKKFGQESPLTYIVYPYLLKQYNDRWYLICQLIDAERDFLMNLPLDRIYGFKEEPEIPFKECYCDIDERNEDIVGITYHDDRPVETILFAIPDYEAPYINTKPIHGSQTLLPEREHEKLRNKYPSLSDYIFYTITCIPNRELLEELSSFNKGIIVLHKGLQKEIFEKMQKQVCIYNSINRH
ncbi:MAG: WYL domain-containing protein [Bacteroidaceae bacterium]|nr:WYL domain-containing protein [Bacteroidaceae bacterium]